MSSKLPTRIVTPRTASLSSVLERAAREFERERFAIARDRLLAYVSAAPFTRSREPALPAALVMLAKCHAALGAIRECLASLQAARKLAPRDLEVQALIAQTHLRLGDDASARRVAQRVLKSSQIVEANLVMAELFRRDGKMDEALRHCYAALESDLSRYEVYEILAEALEGLGLHGEATEIMRAAVNRIPRGQRTVALLRLARMARDAQRFDLAESTLRQLLKTRAARDEVYTILGEVYGQTRRVRDAIRAAKKALQINPRNMDALHLLTAAHMASGAMGEAIRTASAAVELWPSDPVTRFKLGVLLHQQGDIRGALKQYRLIVNLGGSATAGADAGVADAADEAIANIEQYQFQQILVRCSEDALFRLKLRRDVETTLHEYGYAPSASLVATIRSVEVDQLLQLPSVDRPARYH